MTDADTETSGEEWRVWADYDQLLIGVQHEGRRAVFLKPDEAEAKADTAERLIDEHDIDPGEADGFHIRLRTLAAEIRRLRAEKSE